MYVTITRHLFGSSCIKYLVALRLDTTEIKGKQVKLTTNVLKSINKIINRRYINRVNFTIEGVQRDLSLLGVP